MKQFVLVVILALSTGSSPNVSGRVECSSIKDGDRRNFCMALATGNKTYCSSIKNSDMRHQCRALVK